MTKKSPHNRGDLEFWSSDYYQVTNKSPLHLLTRELFQQGKGLVLEYYSPEAVNEVVESAWAMDDASNVGSYVAEVCEAGGNVAVAINVGVCDK